jgi:hypothetical protein
MARTSEEEVAKIKKAIADLLYNHKDKLKFANGKPSPTQISELLDKEYNLKVTRQSVALYLEKGVDLYRQSILTEDNDKINDIKEAMKIQKGIWNDKTIKPADRTKASVAWAKLQKQLIDYEKQLTDAQIKKLEVSRPVYLIKIEAPPAFEKCPKCGHKWYKTKDKKEDKENDKQKPFFNMDDKEQKTIYVNDDKNENDKKD